MTTTRRRWIVRTVVPVTAQRPRLYQGFKLERVRAPRASLDRGLYVVRTPDGIASVAILRGHSHGSTPHIVSLIRNRLEIGTELARFWPTKTAIAHSSSLRDAVGDFNTAVRFACQQARGRQLTQLDTTSSPSAS
jgi:hypothetical protein